jgi:hypothetical protein
MMVSLFVLATGAEALMAPQYYQKARADAPYHVQIAVTHVAVPSTTPGNCTIEGKVVQIFRNASGKLAPGASIGFGIACMRPGDKVLIGGTMWTEVDALSKARYVEAYLVDAGAGFDVALWQSRIIDAPSSTPQFPVD